MTTSTIISVVNTPSDQIVTTPTTAKTLTNGQIPKATADNQLIDTGLISSQFSIDNGGGATLVVEGLSGDTQGTLSALIPNAVGFNGAVGVVGDSAQILIAKQDLSSSFTMTLANDGIVECVGALKTQGRARTITTFTADETILNVDDLIVCNSATPITITLPPATGTTRCFTIKNINTGLITLEGNGTDTIDGELNQTIEQWESIDVADYNTGIWIIN